MFSCLNNNCLKFNCRQIVSIFPSKYLWWEFHIIIFFLVAKREIWKWNIILFNHEMKDKSNQLELTKINRFSGISEQNEI